MSFLLSLLFRLSVSLSIDPSAGWFSDLTNWFLKIFKQIWDAFVQFVKDVVLFILDIAMQLVTWIISAIPVPDFLSQYSIGALLGNAGPTVGWVMSEMKIGQAMAIIAAGYAFRLLRKFLTLFQW